MVGTVFIDKSGGIHGFRPVFVVPIASYPDIQNRKIGSSRGKKREWLLPNFITCIKEGGLPVSDVFTHVQSVNACHLAAICARLNREVLYNPKTETTGDPESAAFLVRERRAGYDIPDVG